jgi:GntR family transcriptional regulator
VIFPGGPRISGYAELADLLREQITNGDLLPGRRLPAENDLAQMYAVGRDTVRRAIKVLRTEGLVDYVRGWGMVVREPGPIEDVLLESGDVAVSRPPTAEERERFDIGEGVSVFVVTHLDGSGDLYPGDRYRLRVN